MDIPCHSLSLSELCIAYNNTSGKDSSIITTLIYSAKDRTSFSTVHLNHADRGTTHCNCIRILDDNASAVCFFTSRVIEKDEELCFDYGANFWSGREDCKV